MKNTKLIVILFVVCLIFSCKKEEKINLNSEKNSSSKIVIDFPDTIVINKFYDGKISYKGDLDTVTKILNKIINGKISRTLEYNFVKSSSTNYENEHLKEIVTDTAFAEYNDKIPLFLKFEKLGINYIDGLIKDEAFIDTLINNKKEKKTRIITNEFRVIKRVFVVNDK